jgi:hypothetical protein
MQQPSQPEMAPSSEAEVIPLRPHLRARLWAELRSRPIAYIVLAIFLVGGPVATHFLFPEAPTGVGLIGGLAFGAYAALCAVPQKFL